MAKQFAVVPTREGLEGVKDKAAIMDAIARRVARGDREFVNEVREIVKNAGNEADRKVAVWVKHCKGITYTREYGEIFAHPMDTLKKGGDCDDMVILLLAGLHSLLIPCCPDIITKDGEGVHVRARVGLPPTNPPLNRADWLVADPVEDSEKAWAMVSLGTKTPLLGQSFDIGQGVQSVMAQQPDVAPSMGLQPDAPSMAGAQLARLEQPRCCDGGVLAQVEAPALAGKGSSGGEYVAPSLTRPQKAYGALALLGVLTAGILWYAVKKNREPFEPANGYAY